MFATGSCVERERERASSKYCYSLQLPRPGYRERTTGNLEVKLKRKTKRENTGGCALRSRGETSIHPCCSSDSSRFGDIPCRLPGAPHSRAFEPAAGRRGGPERRLCRERGGLWRGCRHTEPGKPEEPSTPSPSSSSLRPFSA